MKPSNEVLPFGISFFVFNHSKSTLVIFLERDVRGGGSLTAFMPGFLLLINSVTSQLSFVLIMNLSNTARIDL